MTADRLTDDELDATERNAATSSMPGVWKWTVKMLVEEVRASRAAPPGTDAPPDGCEGDCCSRAAWEFDCKCCEGTGEWEDGTSCATCRGTGRVAFPRRSAAPGDERARALAEVLREIAGGPCMAELRSSPPLPPCGFCVTCIARRALALPSGGEPTT